jgi:hypothetical protein
LDIIKLEDAEIPFLGIYSEDAPSCNKDTISTMLIAALFMNEFMKFLGKWMDVEGIILSEVTQSQRNSHNMYSLISGY